MLESAAVVQRNVRILVSYTCGGQLIDIAKEYGLPRREVPYICAYTHKNLKIRHNCRAYDWRYRIVYEELIAQRGLTPAQFGGERMALRHMKRNIAIYLASERGATFHSTVNQLNLAEGSYYRILRNVQRRLAIHAEWRLEAERQRLEECTKCRPA